MIRVLIKLVFIATVVTFIAISLNANLSSASKIIGNAIEIVENKVCSHQWELLSEYDIEEGMTDKLLGNSYKMQVYECSKCEIKEVHKIPNIN